MLSDEEKKAIERLNKRYEFFKENPLATNVWLTLDIHNLGISLNLIEKQSKEIERLKELNLMQRKQLNDAFDRGWIHKNTIEAGIKEIKNKKGDPLIRGAKIRALQSLLKKGNDADVR